MSALNLNKEVTKIKDLVRDSVTGLSTFLSLQITHSLIKNRIQLWSHFRKICKRIPVLNVEIRRFTDRIQGIFCRNLNGHRPLSLSAYIRQHVHGKYFQILQVKQTEYKGRDLRFLKISMFIKNSDCTSIEVFDNMMYKH